jgi:hypothetical protein
MIGEAYRRRLFSVFFQEHDEFHAGDPPTGGPVSSHHVKGLDL